MRSSSIIAVSACALCACGDNTVSIGPPLEHADTLFFAAHPDDDMIFMEPELRQEMRVGSSTTIYATTAGPDGVDLHLFEAAKVAYGKIAGSSDWECGRIAISVMTAEHCRLRDRPISLVDLGLPDGGIPGDLHPSLLQLVDGRVPELTGYYGGSVTSDSVIDVFGAVFDATTPDALQTLELSGSHGRDHSSHMFVGATGVWAAARVGYAGPATWNRGYNVGDDDLEPTLSDDDLAAARNMLGYYEACADHCGPCGQSCSTLNESHELWIARQYQTVRVPAAAGKLVLDDMCLGASLALGDCTAAPSFDLSTGGALRVVETPGACVASTATGDLALEPCAGTPEQYWVLDSDGSLWNGRPPERTADMSYDHMRCLADQHAPTCGATLQAHWRIAP